MAELEQFAGRIVDVLRRTDGDTLAATASVGAATLTVYDTADFDETGGQLMLAGEVYTYDTVDHDAATIHLTSTVTVAAAVDDPVDVFDEVLGQVVVEYVAHVLLDENDADDEPIEVTVNHALVPMLEESTRSGAAESVTLIRDGDDDLTIWQIDGKQAVDVMANEAVLAADRAMDMALQGLTAAQLAQAMLDGEVNIYYADEAPWANGDTTHDDDTGDIWVDTNAPTDTAYRWLSRTWTIIGEASLVSALLAAQSAQTTLDGKIRRLYLDYEPVQDGDAGHFGYGDSLVRTDLDNKEFFWDGDSWEELLVGDDAIAATLTGKVIRTAAAGNRIQMRHDVSGGIIEGFTGSVWESVPGMLDIGSTGSSAASAQGFMRLFSPDMGNGDAVITLLSGTGAFQPFVVLTGELQAWDGIDMHGSNIVQATTISASDVYATTHGTHSGDISGGPSITGGGSWTGGPTISGGPSINGTVTMDSLVGTGGSSFVMVGNSGVLSRGAPSSMRYKEHVKPLDARVSDALLKVDTITWQYKDRKHHGDRTYAGVPAEQLHDLGLGLFVDYDDEGRPDQVRYWELTAPLIALCQRQQTQIDDLTARLDAAGL